MHPEVSKIKADRCQLVHVDQGRTKRWMPFSMGSRDCIGQNLARMNYVTAVAMLLAHFHFELAPEVR